MKQMINYRRLNLRTITSPEYSHVLLLLYWPLFFLAFKVMEKLVVKDYFVMYCPLDDMIPFCEYFVIPYVFWFFYIISMLIYGLLYDRGCFRRFMWSIIISYTAALVIFILFPNGQDLRPVTFQRDNVFTRYLAEFYNVDTNTNVFPSIHVLGAMMVFFAGFTCRRFAAPGWRIYFSLTTVLIILSTLFLKQHSVLDVLGALAICALVYPACYQQP